MEHWDSLIESKQKHIRELEKTAQELGEKIASSREEYELHSRETPILIGRRDELSKQIPPLETEIESKKLELARLRAQITPHTDLSNGINTLTLQREVMTRQNKEIEQVLEELAEKKSTLDLSVRELLTQETRLAQKVLSKKETLADYEQKSRALANLSEEIESKKAEIEQLTIRNEAAVEEITRFPKSIGFYIKKLQSLMDEKGIKIDVLSELQK